MPNRVKQALGFSLVELAIVLGIIGLLLFLFIPTNTTMLVNQRRANTVQKLSNIENALTNFVVVNKRLPCPADGTIVPTNPDPLIAQNAGKEGTSVGFVCTVPNNQVNGVVPWAALGLAYNDVLDAWDNQITYRVGYGLTATGAMDMSACDPAGTAPATSPPAGANINLETCLACTGTFVAGNCTSPKIFLLQKGLNVKSAASVLTTVMDYTKFTGAAYVLISHGENGYGAINGNGQYQGTAARGVAGTLEDGNKNLALTVVSNGPTTFISAPYSNAEDAAQYFDDIVVRPMLFSVISKAQLSPRTH